MRYTEQLKSNLGYYWGILYRCWDIITLGKLKWYLFLVLVTLFYIPSFIEVSTDPVILEFLDLPRIMPPSDVSADLLSTRDFLIIGDPPLIPTLNHYWVMSDAFLPSVLVLWPVVLVGFVGAWLRGEGGIDQIESAYDDGEARPEPGIKVVAGIIICFLLGLFAWHFFLFEFLAPYLPIKFQ